MKNIKLFHTVSTIALGQRLIQQFTKYTCSVRRPKVGKILLFVAITLAGNSVYCTPQEDAASAGPSENQEAEQPQKLAAKKKFVCPTCGYDTNKKWCFDNHIRRHAGDKPYQCPYCKKPFKRKDYAKSHVKVLHPDEKVYYINLNKPDTEDTCTATPPQMPAQRDYRSKSPNSVSRRERSPEPRAASSFPVMSPGKSDQTLSYTNPTAPTNQEPAQHSQIALLPVEMSERNRELAEAYTKDDGTNVDLFETARERLRQYEEFAAELRPFYAEEEIWGLWHNYPLEQPQIQL